jgi:apolipoprotein N-acyltransferase
VKLTDNRNVHEVTRLVPAFAASALMLTVIQPPFRADWLAWVALVPFVLVCRPTVRPLRLAAGAYLVSLAYWLGNLYWLAIVTWVGWAALCAYIAVYWPMMALCIRWCRIKNIPLFAAVPILLVGSEALQGWAFTGFSWRFLAHSQHTNISLIQIADIFGAAGVSFVLAMVNGLIAQMLVAVTRKSVLKAYNLAAAVLVVCTVIGTVTYGNWRIAQSDKLVRPGPLVAAVQTNFPQSVKRSGEAAEQILDELIRHSRDAAKNRPLLIVWPETMVQAVLDQRILLVLDSAHPWRVFAEVVSQHAKNSGAYVLAGAHGGKAELKADSIRLTERYNSAYLYQADGQQDTKRYDKIHLVPFGEFVPFRHSLPFLYNLLVKFTPYDLGYSLTAGKEYTAFEINEGQVTYRFGVVICYEDTVPRVARRLAVDSDGSKRLDWLVNISNDGWFVRHRSGKVLPSTELAQHAAICAFRAVENRLPVVRSVNTGVSCLIDSLGRIQDGFTAASNNFPAEALQRKGLAGWFADRTTIDRRVTFFSKHGQWLDFCCGVCLVALIISALKGKPAHHLSKAASSGKKQKPI